MADDEERSHRHDDRDGSSRESADAAFDALFLERWDGMVRRAFLVVGDVATAEEVVQESFLEVYRRWDAIERHDAYLARTVTTGSIRRSTLARRERPWRAADDGRVPGPEVDALLADALLRTLSPRARAMVVLRFYDGLTEVEIADQVGCRPGTVGPTITRALRKLAKGGEPE